jgi:hypothetical protein
VLLQGIEEGIKEKDAFKVTKLLSIRDIKSIDFGKEKIGILISQMFKADFQNGEVYQKNLSIMRNSKM